MSEKDGVKFYDAINKNGDFIMRAEEVYDEWLANKNKPPQLTELELLQQKTQMLESALLDLANEIGGF